MTMMSRWAARYVLANVLATSSPHLPIASHVPIANDQQSSQPTVSVWYRGTPAGTPRQEDVAAIRALGFTAVTWPAADAAGMEALRKIAAVVGVTVVPGTEEPAMTPASALAPASAVRIAVSDARAAMIPALAWRAVAHGARTVTFEAGAPAGAGLTLADGRTRPWVTPAVAFARQLWANPRLIDVLRLGPRAAIDPPAPADLDVVLLDAGRSWVLVATNTGTVRATAVVRLPRDVPYAIWVSLIDGTTLAMLSTAAGPEWRIAIGPGEAQVFVIDKFQREGPLPHFFQPASSSNAAPRTPALSGPCWSNFGNGVRIATISSRVLPALRSASTNASSAVR